MGKQSADAAEQREKLEVPGLSGIERSLIVNAPSSTGAANKKPVIAPQGPSPLLSRLQNFLPAMESANQDLLRRPPGSASMEIEGEDERPHISMDLSCGLFDLKSAEAAERAERVMNGTAPALLSDDSADSDSESESESEGSIGQSGGLPGKGRQGEESHGGKLVEKGALDQPPGASSGKAVRGTKKNSKIRELHAAADAKE